MQLRHPLLLCFVLLTTFLYAQEQSSCGQKELTDRLYRMYPQLKKKQEEAEASLNRQRMQWLRTGATNNRLTAGAVVLPVVVHIIHNNGPENISDATVLKGIQYLNDAFAAIGDYHIAQSTNTQMSFCMAQRDPWNNATNGITRTVSSYTNMSGPETGTDDRHVKDLIVWDPAKYINIWVVNSIPGNVVGYAYLPSAHGESFDGIVMEAAYLGSSVANNVVLIHEMGHYLGLYHTFENGCTNNDCYTDGDQVCDTPPDQSTAYVSCNATMNSCTTDALSGFNTDKPDLTQDYMDYGNFDCMKVFTPGQVERMAWFIDNIRTSLLSSKACMPPCPAPVKAFFTIAPRNAPVNTPIGFTNQSINATHYKWYVDGIAVATTQDYNTTFPVQGAHIIKLVAAGDNPLCDSAVFTDTVTITCPVQAAFSYTPSPVKIGDLLTFTNNSSNATDYVWKVKGITEGTNAGFTYTFTQPGIYSVRLTAKGICSDSTETLISVFDENGSIPEEKCKAITFQKKYSLNSEDLWDLRPLSDSGYIACGSYYNRTTDSYSGVLVSHFSKAGSVIWSKYFQEGAEARLERIKETSDGNFIAVGREDTWITHNGTGGTQALLMRISNTGNLLWIRKMSIAGSKGDFGRDVTETADGGFAFCGSTNDDGWSATNWMVVKTDAQGNTVWSKTMDNGHYDRAYSIISHGDTLVVCGMRTTQSPGGTFSEIVVVQMKASNGTIIRSRTFRIGNNSVETTSIYKIPGGYMAGAHVMANGFYYANMDQFALQLDDALQPVRAATIDIDVFASVFGGMSPTPDGGFVTTSNSSNWSTTKDATWMAIAKVGPDWKLKWVKKYPLSLAEGQNNYCINKISVTPDGGFITAENYLFATNQGQQYTRIIKTDSAGNTPGCETNDFTANLLQPNITHDDLSWSSVNNLTSSTLTNTIISDVKIKEAPRKDSQRCASSDCSTLKLKGENKICHTGDTITWKAEKNAACIASVAWRTDTSIASIVAATDDDIRLKFKKGGKIILYASILTSCKMLQDSITIEAYQAPAKFDLGPDIALCTNSTVRLSPGAGYETYQWNTGSKDSAITVYQPGKYYVTATDYCSNTYSDTVIISTAPDIKLNLQAQQPRCDGDSVTLSAATGFKSYTWSPDYNISKTSGNSIRVWPGADTTYTVVAVLNDHCTITDSTRVRIMQSAPISIGNDTAFCTGSSVTLYAPPGFGAYQWQDGSTATTFTAGKVGTYWVKALNANGCYSRDTMQVTTLYPLPVVNLGKDGSLCLNDTVLHAGSDHPSYLWQNGSHDTVFTVQATGTYWVQVTSNKGCQYTDTLIVTGFSTVPAGFAPPDTTLCENGTLWLTAKGNWAAYLWSTNRNTPGTNISLPGEYWLQVTGQNGCVARDTITVALKRDCPKVIYFPNSFTPNGDGRNDVFKPYTGAPLQRYYLAIFNRWGQRIFESSTPSRGWDGKIQGHPLMAGTYVYMCRYQFYNDPEQVTRGTIVVIP
ncbi:MAG: M43 family zinc metalloprotease [Chitinophagaceae bacterium]